LLELVISVKKDMDAESRKIQKDTLQKFMAVLGFLLEFRVLYNQSHKPELEFDTVSGFVNVRGIFFIFKNLHYALESQPELIKVITNALRQTLSTIAALGDTEQEEYIQARNNLEDNLFYDENFIKIFAQLARNPKHATIK
jgi:hypothetical protein